MTPPSGAASGDEGLVWSEALAVVSAGLRPSAAAAAARDGDAEWIVVETADGAFFAFSRRELLRRLEAPEARSASSAGAALGLADSPRSRTVSARAGAVLPSAPRFRRPPAAAPTWRLLVQLGPDGRPVAVGYRWSEWLGARPAGRAAGRIAGSKSSPAGRPARAEPPAGLSETFRVGVGSGPPPRGFGFVEMPVDDVEPAVSFAASEGAAGPAARPAGQPAPPAAAPVSAAPPLPDAAASGEDEGSRPLRFPALAADAALAAGAPAAFTVDLVRAFDAATAAGPLAFGELAADWDELPITAQLASPSVSFEGSGRAVLTVRRNRPSLPGRVRGTVDPGLAAGADVWVSASFFYGTRFCGSAARRFVLGAPAGPAQAGSEEAEPGGTGRVEIDIEAARPVVTVMVARHDPGSGRLDWSLHFDAEGISGLPDALDDSVDLGPAAAADTAALLDRFPTLSPKRHRDVIEGFGDHLWRLAPETFRKVYWALWDHYRKPISFQFICDEPNVPWELMRPVRADESEIHDLLAVKHPVARWLLRYRGSLTARLPSGRVYTIAPDYGDAAAELPSAQRESIALRERFGAVPVTATRAAFLDLLRSPPADPVALLHFAGHGDFAPAADLSCLKLERGGELTALDVGKPDVKLGKAYRSLVFFNACEVGRTGSVFGQIGGWADALLGRKFGGFIAPLWSVSDDDASTVAVELVEAVLERRENVGEAVRSIRAKHGDEGPTFLSYLYYGDVAARLPPV